jgi:hypothetical protein
VEEVMEEDQEEEDSDDVSYAKFNHITSSILTVISYRILKLSWNLKKSLSLSPKQNKHKGKERTLYFSI